MDSKVMDLCTMCCQFSCSFKRISGNQLDFIKFLLRINTTPLQDTHICETCSQKIEDAYNFKKSYSENVRKTLVSKEGIDFNIFCLCCICRNIVEKSASELLDLTKDFKQKFNNLCESSDLKVYENPYVCVSCQKSFANFYSILNLLSIVKDVKVELTGGESSRNDSKIEIKQEPLIDNAFIKNELILNEHRNPCEEIKKENKEFRTNDDFMFKTEELNLKVKSEDCFSNENEIYLKVDPRKSTTNEGMRNYNEEDDKIRLLNLQTQYNNVNKHDSISMRIDSKINNKIFNCEECEYNTKRKGDLTRHKLIHKNIDEIESFVCDICGHKAKEKGNLKRHMLVHKDINEIKTFACKFCEYKAKEKSTLTRHLLIHKSINEIETFSCAICGYQAKRKGNLKDHMSIHQNTNDFEMFSCSICQYTTKKKSNLKHHMLIHKSINEIKLFTCNVCGYQAKRKGNLKGHMSVHQNINEIEMFSCNICQYNTKEKSNLKRHMLTHKTINEIQTFSCELCDYIAKYKYNLKNHMLVHKNINETEMFKCDECDFQTKHKPNLKKHAIIHKSISEIEMFTCDTCGHKTKKRGDLKAHMLIHKSMNDVQTFKCDYCEYKAKRKGSLKRHLLIHKKL